MFKVGDKAVYPAHGVGVIESIESRRVDEGENSYYILRIMDNDLTIMIPTENAKTVGLRETIPQECIPELYEKLRAGNGTVAVNQTWNRRYREYMDKIKTGSVFAVAEVLSDLFHLKEDKELSFGERKMLDMALNLLVREIAAVEDEPEEAVEENIRHIFSDNGSQGA